MSEDVFDSDKAAFKTRDMWVALGEQIAAAIPLVISGEGDPVKAVKWATCAEACFWQATGEGTPHDVKDVLRPAAQTSAMERP